MEKPIIFVSCGQSTKSERLLGRDVCELIRTLRPDTEPYFGDNQSTSEGLSSNILKALYTAAGFVCVMHRRGDIETPDKRTVTRGSVWIEQEIAVTAFMSHVLERFIPVLFYKEAGISLEGIRSVLVMNPRKEFTENSQVLEDLRLALPSAAFNPFHEYDIEPRIDYRCKSYGNGDLHQYELIADVENVGKKRITDFLLQVYFPRVFLNPSEILIAENKQLSTRTHICFEADSTRAPAQGLYAGKKLSNPLTIDYFVDNERFHDDCEMRSQIIVELFSETLHKKRTLNFRDYQQF